VSRPPYPHPVESTGREQTGDPRRLDYLPLEYADLLALQEDLAVSRLSRPRPQSADDVQEADLARTFMELSALVGHVLSAYQRHYAAEAYIGTAQAQSSLVRHAHRLAYEPDPGLAANGYVVLFAKDNVGGTVEAGLPLASTPLGDIKAQDYESRDSLVIDAALNELLPVEAQRPVEIHTGSRTLRLAGVGHGLEVGDVVALVGPSWRGYIVTSVEEDVARDATSVGLDRNASVEIDFGETSAGATLHAHPALTLRPFGATADPVLYPPDELRNASEVKPDAGTEKYWYTVARSDTAVGGADVYLSEVARETLRDRYVLRSTGTGFAVFLITAEVAAAVTFNREAEETFTTPTVTLTEADDGSFTTEAGEDLATTITVASHISGTVTAIRVANEAGAGVPRSGHPFPAEWLTGWEVEAALAATEPNPDPVGESLDLPGHLEALVPGRPLVFSDLDETVAQVVTVRRAELIGDGDEAVTRIRWDAVSPAPEEAWTLDDFKVFGNVARVSHGRTVQETLGGSDGVSPFQRFALRESPVTLLPGVAGGEPELEVRVDDVLWERVQDFAESGPDDRHYRTVTDEELVTSVVFGDGRNGAVPPSGRKNITAVYRVGLGRAGDVEPRRLSRLKRAHPLVDRLVNVTSISGGAEPADADAIRSQSTRWIRTFDRAVSVSDFADLGLTMPGIARAASRSDGAGGAVLVVASSTGEPPPDLVAVRAFLDARRDVGVALELRGPEPRDLWITVYVEADPAFLAEAVLDAVRAALHGDDEDTPGMFTFPARELGQPAFLSEVYERLEAVTGVVGVRVLQFAADVDADLLADVITADVDQWLRLSPTNFTVTTTLPADEQ
jgi:predicted phage baseplate assembly protein